MERRHFFLALGAFVTDTEACATRGFWKDWAAARSDRRKQKRIVRELTAKADGIFIGELIQYEEGSEIWEYRVTKAIKGDLPIGHLRFKQPFEVVVGCGAAANFALPAPSRKNPQMIYVARGELLRTSDISAERYEIPYETELKIVKATLAPNNSVDR